MKTPMVVSDFRDGLKVGALLIQNCNDCNKPNMWPRYACPHCQSDNLGWVKSAGTGTLHSFCVLRQGAPTCSSRQRRRQRQSERGARAQARRECQRRRAGGGKVRREGLAALRQACFHMQMHH